MEEELKKNIAQAIRHLYSIALNHWVSVREHPIGEVLKDLNINRKYYSAISTVLKDAGLLFTEGEKGTMRYKFDEVAVLDADTLASKVIEIEKLTAAQYRASRPKKNKQPKEKPSAKTLKMRKEPIPLGTIVYFIDGDAIVEGEIYSSRFATQPSNRLYEYEVRFIRDDEVKLVSNPKLFLSPKELMEYHLNHIISYKKETLESLQVNQK